MQRFNFPGDVHFVTFRTDKSQPYFKDKRCCELFLGNLEFYREKYNLKIYGYVILWEHVHLLIGMDFEKFPELTISKVMQDFKSMVARQMIDYFIAYPGSQEPPLLARPRMEQGLHATHNESKNHKRGLKYKIWQPGFYDFNVHSIKKSREKLNYIHKNPIKHGLVNDISQYKFCSWRNYEMNDHSTFKINYFEY